MENIFFRSTSTIIIDMGLGEAPVFPGTFRINVCVCVCVCVCQVIKYALVHWWQTLAFALLAAVK